MAYEYGKWEGEYVVKFHALNVTGYTQPSVEQYINYGFEKGYEVHTIFDVQGSKWSRSNSGTRIIFRKIPETVEVKTFNFEAGFKRLEKSLKGIEEALTSIAFGRRK